MGRRKFIAALLLISAIPAIGLIVARHFHDPRPWGETSGGLRIGIACDTPETPANRQPRFTVRILNTSFRGKWIPRPDALVPVDPASPDAPRARPLRPIVEKTDGRAPGRFEIRMPTVPREEKEAVYLKARETVTFESLPLEENDYGNEKALDDRIHGGLSGGNEDRDQSEGRSRRPAADPLTRRGRVTAG